MRRARWSQRWRRFVTPTRGAGALGVNLYQLNIGGGVFPASRSGASRRQIENRFSFCPSCTDTGRKEDCRKPSRVPPHQPDAQADVGERLRRCNRWHRQRWRCAATWPVIVPGTIADSTVSVPCSGDAVTHAHQPVTDCRSCSYVEANAVVGYGQLNMAFRTGQKPTPLALAYFAVLVSASCTTHVDRQFMVRRQRHGPSSTQQSHRCSPNSRSRISSAGTRAELGQRRRPRWSSTIRRLSAIPALKRRGQMRQPPSHVTGLYLPRLRPGARRAV